MTEADLVLGWARAFLLTLLIEIGMAAPLLSDHAPSWGRRCSLVLFAQLSTHPVVWFVLPALHLSRGAFLLVAETWAWLAEATLYAVALPGLPRTRALGVALAANAASLAVGQTLRALGIPV